MKVTIMTSLKAAAAALLVFVSTMFFTVSTGTPANAQTCTTAALTIQIPQPNPYDEVPAGQLPEPSGVGFTVTLRQVNGLEPHEFDPEMPISDARAMGLGDAVSTVTDSAAQANFAGLAKGVYLVSTTVPNSTEYRQAYVDDFLVALPLGGECSGTVTAKIHYTPVPQTPPTTPPTEPPAETPPPSDGDLAKTGLALAGVGIAGAALVGIGTLVLVGSRKKRQTSDVTAEV